MTGEQEAKGLPMAWGRRQHWFQGPPRMQGNDSLIDYERLVSEAMRDAMRRVLRNVLVDVARDGLPGDHHFYISFNTNAPGAIISKRLHEKYPEEMTIVLQHRFWDLIVHDDRFEVKLQFNSIPERLVVPFESIRVFVDPSVRFGHQFDDGSSDVSEGDAANPGGRGPRAGRSASANLARVGEKRRPSARKRQDKDMEAHEAVDEKRVHPIGGSLQTVTKDDPEPGASERTPQTPPSSEPAQDSPKVISLDKFRKK